MNHPLRNEVERVNQIADAVIEVSASIKKLRAGKLNENGLLVLLKASCGKSVSMKSIKTVLDSLETLEETYVTKDKKK